MQNVACPLPKFNSLPFNKILYLSKFKAIADDKLNMAQVTKYDSTRVENNDEKGENADKVTSNFSFSHSVYYSFGKLSAIFIKFEIVVCKLFQFDIVVCKLFQFGRV